MDPQNGTKGGHQEITDIFDDLFNIFNILIHFLSKSNSAGMKVAQGTFSMIIYSQSASIR